MLENIGAKRLLLLLLLLQGTFAKNDARRDAPLRNNNAKKPKCYNDLIGQCMYVSP